LAGNVAFYTWPSLGCPSAIGWREELVAVVGRPTTAVLHRKGHFAFVGMFPHLADVTLYYALLLHLDPVALVALRQSTWFPKQQSCKELVATKLDRRRFHYTLLSFILPFLEANYSYTV
jgi:hypothetical protein